MVKIVELSPETQQAIISSINANSNKDTSTATRPSTEELVEQWLSQDQNPETRQAVQHERTSLDRIDKWFYPRISFGTAGLRARMGPGYAQMNDLVVLQTTLGLARWISKQPLPEGKTRHEVVIGYDGRRNSEQFAQRAASALASHKIYVIWIGHTCHTPLVAFAVKHRKASAGVMVTASHNPKDDNGYKVYAANGCQINTPVDEEIQACIMEDLEVPKNLWHEVQEVEKYESVLSQLHPLYTQAVVDHIGTIKNPPRFVYTALHGTGFPIFKQILLQLSQLDEHSLNHILVPVEAQSTPNPDFPTVKFPNPEEDGALSLAQETASKNDINLIVANDPDADRLSIAERLPNGQWYQLTGDEVGALLGWYTFTKHKQSKLNTTPSHSPQMFTSAVSSSFLSTIGQNIGFTTTETLTGFKWIGNVTLATQQAGNTVLFGYEEALGYMLPGISLDKDGVSAAMLFLQAASEWQDQRHQSPIQVLQSLYEEHGWFETANTYFKSPTVELTASIFAIIQEFPKMVLDALPHGTEVRVRDATKGTDTGESDGRSKLPVVEGNRMVTLWLNGVEELEKGVRVTIRASGTEPKVKIYVECQSRNGREQARQGAVLVLKAVAKTWFGNESLQVEERWEDVLGQKIN